MTTKARSWLVVPLLGALLAVTSCAEMRAKEVREAANRYMDCELRHNYHAEAELYDYKSAATLPPPIGPQPPDPFYPRSMTSFVVGTVSIDGPNAQARVDAVFRATWPGGFIGPDEHHKLVVYLVREGNAWKVDELTTRTRALDAVSGPGAGNAWLAAQRQRSPFRP
jgi:hypothetical protein